MGANLRTTALFLMEFSGSHGTGAPGRDLPKEFDKWSSVYRQFRRWTLSGLWESIMDALNQSGAVPHTLQVIDSTVIRAHHKAAGAKEGLRGRILAVREGRLHDQDSPPCKRPWSAHENRDYAGADFRLSGVRSGHGR